MATKNNSSSAIKTVVLTRTFDAPREVVFKAWTEPEQLIKWWGPHGFTNYGCEVSLKPGGEWKICMNSPEFPNHWCKGVILEVSEHDKLVFTTTAFIDDNDKAGLEGINTVTFEDVNGKTLLTLKAELTKLDTKYHLAAKGMEEGWRQSLEKLDNMLKLKQYSEI